jgi:hypothetical protein
MKWTTSHISTGKLCIQNDKNLGDEILHEAHDSSTDGHFGEQCRLSAIATPFYWKRLWQDLKSYCKGCATYARTKPTNNKPFGLLQPLDIPDKYWRYIKMNFITKLPFTAQGNDTIMTFIDGLTKRVYWVVT